MLSGRNISFSYKKDSSVIEDISIDVERGDILGIVAPSGYGKSTLARILAGQIRPLSGEVIIDGDKNAVNASYCPVQLICQNPELAVNPLLKMKVTLNEGWNVSKEVMDKFGIRKEWLDRYPSELSGGELQRFCIARALGPKTEYLIADEITTMLDANTQALIWEILTDEVRKRNLGMIVITHNQHLADRVCTKIIRLDKMKEKV